MIKTKVANVDFKNWFMVIAYVVGDIGVCVSLQELSL